MRATFIGSAALAFALVCGPATARDIPNTGLALADVAAWLQGHGYTAQTIVGKDGKSHLNTVIDGVKFGFYMFDCKGDRCGSLQFSAGWATHGKFDVSQMNRWNRDKRWCRGYFDSENDPWVEQDVDLTPGGTYELLDDQFNTYQACVRDFRQMYGV